MELKIYSVCALFLLSFAGFIKLNLKEKGGDHLQIGS